jgi:hypothetical protein
MALVVADRVKETTTTTGTGAITLAGAEVNFVAFSSVLSDGDTTYYAIVDDSNQDFEVGLGTYATSGNTLTRTTVLASSNGGSAVDLSAGSKEVFINYPAGKSVYLDGSGQLVIGGTAVTSTAAELNILDGVTSTTAELNLLDGSTANTVVNSKAVIYGSSGEITSAQLDITGQGDLRLQDSTGGEYVGLQAPATVGSSFTLTLPTADGTADQVLSTNGSGVLSFADAGGGSWTLLNTYTPSAASTVDMEDFSSTYDVYKIIYRVRNNSTANEILMYLKIGGSYQTSGYDWMNIISSATDGGTYTTESNQNTSEIRIYQSNPLDSNTLTYGEITFPFVNTSGLQVINWDTTTQAPAGEPMRAIGGVGGYMGGSGTITGARFQFANSATATGTFWVYALTAST